MSPQLVLITGVPGSGKSTMADVAGRALGAPVLGHDWVMSGLRPYDELQAELDAMGVRGHRGVGWSLLWALARSQLRRGSSVVLDGVARDAEVRGTRQLAAEEGAGECLVVMTSCADAGLHRARVEGRQRQIPGWYELEWDHVERVRSSWVAPDGLDLVLDAGEPMEANAAAMRRLLAERS
ncbi:MAG TPA: AAA family ATPase [Acidimicrobiales bacterium]|nr:AAA family ATPase [Acidimicrobiales bacterium]